MKNLFVLIFLTASITIHAQVISWNLDRFGTISGGNQAGVVLAPNWNNSWPANPTANLIDNTGTATTMGLSYASFNQWSVKRHGKGATIGCFGGSSESIRYQVFTNMAGGDVAGSPTAGGYSWPKANPSTPNRLWCRPDSNGRGL